MNYCTEPFTGTDRDAMCLQGPVRHVRIETAKLLHGADGVMEGTRLPCCEYTYDQNGDEIGTVYYDDNGDLAGSTVFVRDDQGRLIEKTFLGPDGLPNGRNAYEYDTDGNLVRMAGLSADGSTAFEALLSWKNRRLSTQTRCYFKPDGSLEDRETINYDESGREAGRIQHMKGDADLPTSHTYVQVGDTLEQHSRYCGSNGGLYFTSITVADQHGRVIRRDDVDEAGVTIFHAEYTYDDMGNETEYWSTRGKGINRKRTYEYEYDSLGNWTCKTIMVWVDLDTTPRPQPEEVVYQIIEYYP